MELHWDDNSGRDLIEGGNHDGGSLVVEAASSEISHILVLVQTYPLSITLCICICSINDTENFAVVSVV